MWDVTLYVRTVLLEDDVEHALGYPCTLLQDASSQETTVLIFTANRTSNIKQHGSCSVTLQQTIKQHNSCSVTAIYYHESQFVFSKFTADYHAAKFMFSNYSR